MWTSKKWITGHSANGHLPVSVGCRLDRQGTRDRGLDPAIHHIPIRIPGPRSARFMNCIPGFAAVPETGKGAQSGAVQKIHSYIHEVKVRGMPLLSKFLKKGRHRTPAWLSPPKLRSEWGRDFHRPIGRAAAAPAGPTGSPAASSATVKQLSSGSQSPLCG